MGKKFFWVDCRKGNSWGERKSFITASLESGADSVWILPDDLEKAKKLGNISFTSTDLDSDIILVGEKSEGDGTHKLSDALNNSKDLDELKKLKKQKQKAAGYVEIIDKAHEKLAALEAKNADFIIVIGKDWEIIPLENLIAELQKLDVKIVAGAKDAKGAKTALETLEVGADGVLLQTDDVNQIKKTSDIISKGAEKLELKAAKIKTIKTVTMGDRVCVDTASLMDIGEGMLIGSQANGLFLVHSESLESEYVASRPFRVNAGAVHAYILAEGGKTKYLSDLKSGDEVLTVDSKGNTRIVTVGRVKIEKRPLMLIEAEADGVIFKTLLQNAETINLVKTDGTPVSVSRIKEGDEIMLYAKNIGRHFGMEVEESLIER